MNTGIELLEKVIRNLNEQDLNLFFRERSPDYYAPDPENLDEYYDKEFSDVRKIGEFGFENEDRLVVGMLKVASGLTERTGKKRQFDKAKAILQSLEKYDSGIFIFYDSENRFRISLFHIQ